MSDEETTGFDEEEGGGDSTTKKASGLGALLPNLLKFVAIGLGALIFIITVAAITFNFMNKSGPSQTMIPESSPYLGNRPTYSYFSAIGQITTRTRDPVPYSVVVDMQIGYDENNTAAASELTTRLPELRDFVRKFFSSCYVEDLYPNNEEKLKQRIIEQLNTNLLNTARARNIVFIKLDYLSM